MPGSDGPTDVQVAPKTYPTVVKLVAPGADGVLSYPEMDKEQEEITGSAFLTIFTNQLQANGETPIMEFEGRDQASTKCLKDSYSTFCSVRSHLNEQIAGATALLSNLQMCVGDDSDTREAFADNRWEMVYDQTVDIVSCDSDAFCILGDAGVTGGTP